MGESGYYPPGAEHDPRAPYNQRLVTCPNCGGAESVPIGPRDEFGNQHADECNVCEGAGEVDEAVMDDFYEPDVDGYMEGRFDDGP